MNARDRKPTKFNCGVIAEVLINEAFSAYRDDSKIPKKVKQMLGNKLIDSCTGCYEELRIANEIKLDHNIKKEQIRRIEHSAKASEHAMVATTIINKELPLAIHGIEKQKWYNNISEISIHTANSVNKYHEYNINTYVNNCNEASKAKREKRKQEKEAKKSAKLEKYKEQNIDKNK